MSIRELLESENILCKESKSYREDLREWLVELGLKRPRRSEHTDIDMAGHTLAIGELL